MLGTEIEKIVRSVARFLVGAKPKHSKTGTYYFMKRSLRLDTLLLLHELKRRCKGVVCPFCGKRFRRRGSLVAHLIRDHSLEILECLGMDRELKWLCR